MAQPTTAVLLGGIHAASNMFHGAHDFSASSINATYIGGNQVVNHVTHTHQGGTVGAVNRQQEIRKWMKAPRFTHIHGAAKEQRTDGTGTWFIESREFQQYIQKKGCILWCTGKPGSGKTILASTSIEQLRQQCKANSRKAVVYAYLRYDEKHTPRDVFVALLDQLLVHKEAIVKITPSYLEKKEDNDEYTLKEVVRILGEIIGCLDQVYAVIDGLDEASSEVKNELVHKLPPMDVNLLIFSRPLQLYTDCTPAALQIHIQARTDDIVLYVSEECGKNPELKALFREHTDKEDELRHRIRKQADGMFLLARLQLEAALLNATSIDSLFSSLEKMPSELDDMYAITLKRIHDQGRDRASIAYRLFAWLLFHVGWRDLPAEAVQRMLAVSVESRTWKNTAISPVNTILSACHGLVTVSELGNHGSQSEFRFVHYSTAEYLRKHGIPTIPDAHSPLAATCVLYLEHHIDMTQDAYCYSDLDYNNEDHLLAYSLENWSRHSNKALWAEEAHFDIVRSSLAQHPLYPQSGVDLLSPPLQWMPSLSVVAANGCVSIIQKGKLEFPSFPSEQQTEPAQISPFHAAAYHGHFNAFLSLVSVYGSQGLSFWSSKNRAIPSILHIAAQSSHAVSFLKGLFAFADSPPTEMAKLVISGFEINSQDSGGQTALMLACENQLKDTAGLLIARPNILVNLQDAKGKTALMLTCESWHRDIAGLLIARPDILI
ncbi:hypothetical protein NMY22_g17503 [Coprinellus aureogranulatus]|nr:hypothetical protein NMY22_g17503 [Coprinellus aureogranulatus]